LRTDAFRFHGVLEVVAADARQLTEAVWTLVDGLGRE
jgi:hypothetical protein